MGWYSGLERTDDFAPSIDPMAERRCPLRRGDAMETRVANPYDALSKWLPISSGGDDEIIRGPMSDSPDAPDYLSHLERVVGMMPGAEDRIAIFERYLVRQRTLAAEGRQRPAYPAATTSEGG